MLLREDEVAKEREEEKEEEKGEEPSRNKATFVEKMLLLLLKCCISMRTYLTHLPRP